MDPIESFLSTAQKSPLAKTLATDAVSLIRASVPEAERDQWTRRRILAALAEKGFPTGVGSARKRYIIGLTLPSDAAPQRLAVNADGRIILV
jgi:hypothetical protein